MSVDKILVSRLFLAQPLLNKRTLKRAKKCMSACKAKFPSCYYGHDLRLPYVLFFFLDAGKAVYSYM